MQYILLVAPLGVDRMPVKETVRVTSLEDYALNMTWFAAVNRSNHAPLFTAAELAHDHKGRFPNGQALTQENAEAAMQQLCDMGLARRVG